MSRIGTLCLLLPTDHYTGIGAVLHHWATLEFQLQNIIWRAMNIDNKQGRVLTIGMSIEALSGILRNLPRKWITDKQITADLNKLLDDVKDAVGYRNALAHGVWTVFKDDRNPVPHLNYMKKAAERLMPTGEPVTPADLQKLATLVDVLNRRADSILRALGGAQLPSPDIPD